MRQRPLHTDDNKETETFMENYELFQSFFIFRIRAVRY